MTRYLASLRGAKGEEMYGTTLIGGSLTFVLNVFVAAARETVNDPLQPGLLVVQVIIGALALIAIFMGARAIKSTKVLDAEKGARQAAESLAEILGHKLKLTEEDLKSAHDLNHKQANTIADLQERTDIRPFVEQTMTAFNNMQETSDKRFSDMMLVMSRMFESTESAHKDRHEEVMAALRGLQRALEAR